MQTQRAAAQSTLDNSARNGGKAARTVSREEIRGIVEGFGGLLALLRQADPANKAEFYRRLGLRLTYDHETRMVLAETRPAPSVCAKVVSEGGLEPPRPIKGTSTSS